MTEHRCKTCECWEIQLIGYDGEESDGFCHKEPAELFTPATHWCWFHTAAVRERYDVNTEQYRMACMEADEMKKLRAALSRAFGCGHVTGPNLLRVLNDSRHSLLRQMEETCSDE